MAGPQQPVPPLPTEQQDRREFRRKVWGALQQRETVPISGGEVMLVDPRPEGGGFGYRIVRRGESAGDVFAPAGSRPWSPEAAARQAAEAVTPLADEPSSQAVPNVQQSDAVSPSVPVAGRMASARPIKTAEAITSTGRRIPVEYRLVEAADLVTSNDDDLKVNPAYPQELQPRDRTRGATELQITEMLSADRFRPELLGESPDGANGAPVVSPEGEVESGNMRSMALRRAYARDLPAATAYREWLASQGYPVEDMAAPVLVRVRTEAMPMDERAAAAREMNQPAQQAMSATELAMADARAMSAETLALYRGGDLTLAQNRGFVRAFANEVIPQQQRNAFFTTEGAVSQEGLRRIRAALLSRAYDANDIVAALVESTDGGMKRIADGLMLAAPGWAQMRGRALAKEIEPAMDVTAHLVEAVRTVFHARDQGRNVAEFVGQSDMFGGGVDPRALWFLRLMHRDAEMANTRAGDKIAGYLLDYVEQANASAPDADMFGRRADPGAALEQVATKAAREGQPAAGSGNLFARRPQGDGGDGQGGQAGGPPGEGPRPDAAEPPAGAVEPAVEAADPAPLAEPATPEATPATPAPEPPAPPRMIQDAGEKIGGARKDQWRESGLALSDLDDMSAGEQYENVTKDNVWPRPNYAKLIEAGVKPQAAYLIKLIYDGMAARPRIDNADTRRAYVEMIGNVRAVAETVRTVDDAKALQEGVFGRIGWRTGNKNSAPESAKRLLFSIYKGRTSPLALSYADLRKANDAVLEGWPEPKKSTREPKDGERGKMPDRPHLDRIERAGPERRAGARDVGSEDFVKDFGFRGVEFGNWVASDERQKSVNLAYDALHDLADVMGVPADALSLNGTLGLAFGARGTGRAAAHYEPGKLVINLTKLSGAGSLAHEWAHAIDHYMGELDRQDGYSGKPRGASGWYDQQRYDGTPNKRMDRATGKVTEERRLPNVRPELAEAIDRVMQTLFYRQRGKAEVVRQAELSLERVQADIARAKTRLDAARAQPAEDGAATALKDANIKRAREYLEAMQSNEVAFQKRLAETREAPEDKIGRAHV